MGAEERQRLFADAGLNSGVDLAEATDEVAFHLYRQKLTKTWSDRSMPTRRFR